jgi:hypothetical protein
MASARASSCWLAGALPAAAVRHLARLGAMADRRPNWLWRPLGPTSRTTSSASKASSTYRSVPTARANTPSRVAPARPGNRER